MIRAIMSLLAAAVLLPVLAFGCTGQDTESGENNMLKAEIPAIDANKPAVTATATFALG